MSPVYHMLKQVTERELITIKFDANKSHSHEKNCLLHTSMQESFAILQNRVLETYGW